MFSRFPKVLLAIVAAFVLCLAYGLYRANAKPFQEIPDEITNFEAIDVIGGKKHFEEMKGKATLIVLSAAWCPACIAELPILDTLQKEFAADGFKVLMVSEDDNVKAAARFKKKYRMQWTMVHWNYELMNALGNPRVIPVSYLVDSEGKIDYVEAGIIEESRMRRAIRSVLR